MTRKLDEYIIFVNILANITKIRSCVYLGLGLGQKVKGQGHSIDSDPKIL